MPASDAAKLKVNSAVERMVAANIVVVVAAGNEAERCGFGVQCLGSSIGCSKAGVAQDMDRRV